MRVLLRERVRCSPMRTRVSDVSRLPLHTSVCSSRGLDHTRQQLTSISWQGGMNVARTAVLGVGDGHGGAAPHGSSAAQDAMMKLAGHNPPWRQPWGKSMVSSVNSHTNAARIGWHLWEIDLRFATGLPPGWPES